MTATPEFGAATISLKNAAIFLFDARFVLRDIEISEQMNQIMLRMAAPIPTEVIEAISATWVNADPLSAAVPSLAAPCAVPSPAAPCAVPSEAVWAQRAVPSEAVWAQRAIPSEAVWAQQAVPSEAVWARHEVPSESIGSPVSAADFNAMFAALAFHDPVQPSWTPVTIVGLRDGRRCAVTIARAAKLSLAREEIRIDAHPSDPRVSMAGA